MSPSSNRSRFLVNNGHIPNGVVHVQPHEPTEQQVIVELFHQQPFAAHRVQRLQQQRSQQLLRPIDGRPVFGVQLVEPWLQSLKASSVMTRRGRKGWSWALAARAYVAKHIQLLLVFSTHAFFLSGCAVETREFFCQIARWSRLVTCQEGA